MAPNRPQDVNNVQPRAGVAYSLNNRTVCAAERGVLRRCHLAERAVGGVRATIALYREQRCRSQFRLEPVQRPLPPSIRPRTVLLRQQQRTRMPESAT